MSTGQRGRPSRRKFLDDNDVDMTINNNPEPDTEELEIDTSEEPITTVSTVALQTSTVTDMIPVLQGGNFIIPFNVRAPNTRSFEGAKPLSEATVTLDTWNDHQLVVDEKNVMLSTSEDGTTIAMGKFYVEQKHGEHHFPFEARFAVKDKRDLKMGVSKWESSRGVKLMIQVPLFVKHEADKELITNLMVLQGHVWSALRNSKTATTLGWHTLQPEELVATPIVNDMSLWNGPGWYSVKVKWDKFKNGFEPGRLWNMTKIVPKRGIARGIKATHDGFYLDEEQPHFNINDVQKKTGIDGSFRINTWWADSTGKWGITASIASMRIYPRESFINPLAMVIEGNKEDKNDHSSKGFSFNY